MLDTSLICQTMREIVNQLEYGRSVDYDGPSSSGQPRVDGSGLLMRVTALCLSVELLSARIVDHMMVYHDHVTFPFVYSVMKDRDVRISPP